MQEEATLKQIDAIASAYIMGTVNSEEAIALVITVLNNYTDPQEAEDVSNTPN